MAFDVEAYRRQQSGVDPDKGLLVTFRHEAKEVDGKFENIPYINIWMGKNSTIDRPVTEEDKVRFEDRWKAFEKGEEPVDGMPIKEVPFATAANVAACRSEQIYTVEQLIETPDQRLQRAHLVNFKYMCRDMWESRKDNAHVQKLRDELEKANQKIAALEEKMSQAPKKRGRPRKVNGDNSDAG